jgi:hypothetical protein
VHSEFCSQDTNKKYRIAGEYVYSIQDPDMYNKILRAENELEISPYEEIRSAAFQ